MKKQIEDMIKKLKSNGEGSSNAAMSSAPNQPSRRQSFYTEFHQKAMEKAEERYQQKQKGKGKGKGKTKGKDGKGKEASNLPKYDLRQAFPTMSVNSWVSVMKDVEEGREPKGAVAVCPDMQTVAEIQALSQVHELKNGILFDHEEHQWRRHHFDWFQDYALALSRQLGIGGSSVGDEHWYYFPLTVG